jgi:hypothetical protein
MSDEAIKDFHEKLQQKYMTDEYRRIRTGLSHGGRKTWDGTIEECWCSDCLYTHAHEPTLK